MRDLEKNKGKTNLLLFTRWDRFSRNTSKAYQMIDRLKNFDIEPKSIEQPLNMAVPENKMILAVYLSAPEIENERRGLSTKAGIRQAKKEGRWTNKAPLGYANKTTEYGNKYIAFKEPDATIIKWVFDQLSEEIYSAEQIMKVAWDKKLKCSKNNFLRIIRNPVYCGKVVVPACNDEESSLVKGQHQALISEALFYKVQDILDRRRKRYGLPIATPKDLPLRNFLRCPKCLRMLTGSASKGKTKYSIYYHCRSSCGVRFKADEVNNAFIDYLKVFAPKPSNRELLVEVLENYYKNHNGSASADQKDLVSQINTLSNQIDYARQLMLTNDIDAEDFRKIKKEWNEKIKRLELRLNVLTSQYSISIPIRHIAEQAVSTIIHVDKLYEKADVNGKRYIVVMLFPDKITYDAGIFRTLEMNQAAQFIYLKNKELQSKKRDKNLKTDLVPFTG